MIKRRSFTEQAFSLAASLLLLSACRHKPVYPEVGDAIIDSDPRGAEVFIDGVNVHLMTPCRVIGIEAGVRRLTLCLNNHKTIDRDIEVKPGQIVRRFYRLSQVEISVIAGAGINYVRCVSVDTVGNEAFAAVAGQLLRYRLTDSSITLHGSICIKGTPTALAVDPGNGRLFYVRRINNKASLACTDLNSGLEIREYIQPDSSRYVKLRISPDGDILLVADSLGRRLLVMDARLFSMVKAIPLSGCPSDVIFGPRPDEAYVTLCSSKRIARVDLEAGQEREWAPTGNNPRGLFWSRDWAQLGCCNSTDKELTLVDMRNWASATGVNGSMVGGVSLPAACWSEDQFYIIVLIRGRGVNEDFGALNIVYTRNWMIFNRISLYNKGFPVEVVRLPRLGRYLLTTDGGFWLLRGDFRD